MKFKAGELLIWFYISYLLFSPIRDLADGDSLVSMFGWLSDGQELVLILTTLIPFFTYSLLTYTILFFTHRHGKPWMGVGLIIGVLPVAILFRYALQEVIQKSIFGFGNYYEGVTLFEYFMDNLYYGLFFPWVGGLFYFVQYARFRDQQQQTLQIENQQAQLSLLRSQVNPHFLFNALNNIYSLVYSKSAKSLDALEKLSSLLRYSLYEQDEKVPLGKEISFIYDFIELERLRFDHPISISFDIRFENQSYQIIPFLLIPFVENAFKHGDTRHKKYPISLTLYTEDQFLIFEAKNAVKQTEKDLIGGIGLKNISKRLDLYYGKNHMLDIENDGDIFSARLKIAISQC